MVRAIMEGVAYAMRDSLEIIRELGVPVKQIRASGGGSKSPLWRQIQADVFGQKVVTINAEEGPAYGVALLAAVGGGAFKNVEEACSATIRVVKETPAQKPRSPSTTAASRSISSSTGRSRTISSGSAKRWRDESPFSSRRHGDSRSDERRSKNDELNDEYLNGDHSPTQHGPRTTNHGQT